MTTFWFFLTAFSSVLAIFLWLRDEWKKVRNANNYYRLLYPVFFIVLSIISITQYYQLDEMSKMENEATIISKNWPSTEMIKYLPKGERIGIILAGQTFLEKHKTKFPDTYRDFQDLKKRRLGSYGAKQNFSDSQKEYDDLEDVCGATITIIKNLTKN
mgnify:FL=1